MFTYRCVRFTMLRVYSFVSSAFSMSHKLYWKECCNPIRHLKCHWTLNRISLTPSVKQLSSLLTESANISPGILLRANLFLLSELGVNFHNKPIPFKCFTSRLHMKSYKRILLEVPPCIYDTNPSRWGDPSKAKGPGRSQKSKWPPGMNSASQTSR